MKYVGEPRNTPLMKCPNCGEEMANVVYDEWDCEYCGYNSEDGC